MIEQKLERMNEILERIAVALEGSNVLIEGPGWGPGVEEAIPETITVTTQKEAVMGPATVTVAIPSLNVDEARKSIIEIVQNKGTEARDKLKVFLESNGAGTLSELAQELLPELIKTLEG